MPDYSIYLPIPLVYSTRVNISIISLTAALYIKRDEHTFYSCLKYLCVFHINNKQINISMLVHCIFSVLIKMFPDQKIIFGPNWRLRTVNCIDIVLVKLEQGHCLCYQQAKFCGSKILRVGSCCTRNNEYILCKSVSLLENKLIFFSWGAAIYQALEISF